VLWLFPLKCSSKASLAQTASDLHLNVIRQCSLTVRTDFTLTLKSVRGKSGGGVLVVRAKEEQLGQSATAALDESRLARQQLSRTLETTDTVSSIIDLIPSLSPFLDLADKIATVRYL
jgi:hypothetical protein